MGYLLYGRLVDAIFAPDDRATPAIALADGVDYVPMPRWKAFLIQLREGLRLPSAIAYPIGITAALAAFIWCCVSARKQRTTDSCGSLGKKGRKCHKAVSE